MAWWFFNCSTEQAEQMRLEGWPEVACSSWGCGCATATTNWLMTVGSSPVLQPKGVFGTFWLLAQQMLASSCELWFQTLPSPLDTAASSEQQEQGKLMVFLFVCFSKLLLYNLNLWCCAAEIAFVQKAGKRRQRKARITDEKKFLVKQNSV